MASLNAFNPQAAILVVFTWVGVAVLTSEATWWNTLLAFGVFIINGRKTRQYASTPRL